MLSGGVASKLVAHYTGEQHAVLYAFITGIAGTIGVAVGVWWEVRRARPKADSSRRPLLICSGLMLIITLGHASIGLTEIAGRAEALSVMREISEGGVTSIALQRQSTAEHDVEPFGSPDALREFAEACGRFQLVEHNVWRRHHDKRYVLLVDTAQGVARIECGYNLPSASPVEGSVYGWGAESYSSKAFFISSDLRRWFDRYVDGN